MASRRQFFGQLGAVLTAAAFPGIFVPIGESPWKHRPLQPRWKVRKLKAIWTAELEQDLVAYYNIDAIEKIAVAASAAGVVYVDFKPQIIKPDELKTTHISEINGRRWRSGLCTISVREAVTEGHEAGPG